MALYVKVAQLGGQVKEFCLEDDAVLEDALELADVDAEGMEVRINGRPPVEEEGVVKMLTGDLVLLVPKIEGGSL